MTHMRERAGGSNMSRVRTPTHRVRATTSRQDRETGRGRKRQHSRWQGSGYERWQGAEQDRGREDYRGRRGGADERGDEDAQVGSDGDRRVLKITHVALKDIRCACGRGRDERKGAFAGCCRRHAFRRRAENAGEGGAELAHDAPGWHNTDNRRQILGAHACLATPAA